MSAGDWAVLAGGAAAIAWVNWWFFLAERASVVAAPASGGVAEVVVRVAGGYAPSHVRARAGKPLRLVFDRQESAGCSEEVVIPDFGVRRFLPAHERTTVEVTPTAPGRHEFTCGMGMLRGTIVVE
jgi:plastocyanin domain-containing protein